MLSVTGRLILFVSSYAPLLLLFAILRSFGDGWPSIVCGVVAILSVVALGAVWWLLLLRSTVDFGEFTGARSRDVDVMAYFVTYVVPFAAVGSSDHRTRVALVVFAVIIAILYVRSAVFYVHPLLLLAGYHVYAATRGDVPVIVITRQQHLRQTSRLRIIRVSVNVYLEKPYPEKPA